MSREVIKFVYEDDDGNELEGELPARYEVCPRCEGRGKHVNPNIDGNGITADEWNGPDWDDESREAYLNGGYDVPCERCHGLRVHLVIDEDAIENGSNELKALYKHYVEIQESLAECDAISRMERMMGA